MLTKNFATIPSLNLKGKEVKKEKIFLAWQTVDWASVQKRVRQVQRRIYKASLDGRKKKAHRLQDFLINSFEAKLMAVRLVTTLNKGKSTAGVDGVAVDKRVPLSKEGSSFLRTGTPSTKVYSSSKKRFVKGRSKKIRIFKVTKPKGLDNTQKFKLAKGLKLDGLASPIRRVWIPKPGKSEERPLGIPTIKDRAKQALAKFALEPEWEALFEPNSYGFRPGRRSHDAIEAIFLSLHFKTPKWIFDADIKKCFDRIDHEALLAKLETFPAMKIQIAAWLKADIMEGYASAPKSITASSMGTPQGGVISPLLANIALHGLESHLKEYVANLNILPTPTSLRGRAVKRNALSVIRYADDFVLTHINKEIMDLCIIETSRWLQKIGLEISPEKSALRSGSEGFKFLGFQVIQVRKNGVYKVKITPSREKIELFLLKIRDIIQNNRSASSFQLICKLRLVIFGWANYYKYCECKDTFRKLTHLIFQKIRAWVFRRDTRNGREYIKNKYFPSGKVYSFDGDFHRDNWILVGERKSSKTETAKAFLPHLVWVKSRKFVKVLKNKSPFDGDFIYWTLRMKSDTTLSTRTRILLRKQKGKCSICKKAFSVLDRLEIDHIIPKFKGGPDTYNNLQLLHRACHVQKTAVDLKPIK